MPPALLCTGVLPHGEVFTPEGVASGHAASMCYASGGSGAAESERATEARRLVEGERYEDAIPLLRAVGAGNAGDGKAGRQLAQFRLGVALVKTGHDKEGMALLGAIARDPLDLARPTMLAWLADDSIRHPLLMQLFSGFDDNDTACFKTGHEELHARASYLIARERFERGAYADAMFFLSQVNRKSAVYPPAQECIDLIDKKTKASQGR